MTQPGGPPFGTPLRLSDIKFAIFGGLKFQRVMYAGWSFYPAPGIVARDIDRLGLEFQNFKVPLTQAIRQVMMPSIRKNFEVGGRPDWDPLADYTVQVRGTSTPILVRSGNLARVASSFPIWTIGDTSASIQSLPSNVWYGNIHQAGYGNMLSIARRELGGMASRRDIERRVAQLFEGARPPGQQTKFVIPQREFALFQDEDVDKIQEIFADWMERQADQVGRSWNLGRG